MPHAAALIRVGNGFTGQFLASQRDVDAHVAAAEAHRATAAALGTERGCVLARIEVLDSGRIGFVIPPVREDLAAHLADLDRRIASSLAAAQRLDDETNAFLDEHPECCRPE